MTEQMDLDVYKKKVEECLIKNYNYTTQEARRSIEAYAEILPEYYECKLSPLGMACAITRNY